MSATEILIDVSGVFSQPVKLTRTQSDKEFLVTWKSLRLVHPIDYLLNEIVIPHSADRQVTSKFFDEYDRPIFEHTAKMHPVACSMLVDILSYPVTSHDLTDIQVNGHIYAWGFDLKKMTLDGDLVDKCKMSLDQMDILEHLFSNAVKAWSNGTLTVS